MSHYRFLSAVLLAGSLGVADIGYATDYSSPNSSSTISPNALPAPDQSNVQGVAKNTAPSKANLPASPGTDQSAYDAHCMDNSSANGDSHPCVNVPKSDSGPMSN